MAATNLTICPHPFIDESAYPYTAGFRNGRFCGDFSDQLSCCLPCPVEKWVYSDNFERNLGIAYWINIPALLCQVVLLLSFIILPVEKSHGQYLSVGTCVSLILFELAFIIPLGTQPSHCHDAITPNDLHSDASCAVSGILLEAGAMAGTIWILLRSLWIHLRVCYDIRHSPTFVWISHGLGWGLPALFLAISLPITGVSYRLGSTCIPNQRNAFATWFGWLIAFGCLAALLQFGTTSYCIWTYARHFWQGGRSSGGGSVDMTKAGLSGEGQRNPPVRLGNGMAWRRVKKIMMLQWRSILLSVLVIVETVYFGAVYVAASRAVEADKQSQKSIHIAKWITCLVLTGGNKGVCLEYAKVLSEKLVLASLFMSALIGIFSFMLMFRWSMVTGWYELIRDPCRVWKQKGSNSDAVHAKRASWGSFGMSLRKPSTRHDAEGSPFAATGILPEPSDSVRQLSLPEAGEVSQRHETTNWFDDEDGEEEEEVAEDSIRRVDE